MKGPGHLLFILNLTGEKKTNKKKANLKTQEVRVNEYLKLYTLTTTRILVRIANIIYICYNGRNQEHSKVKNETI